MYLVRCRNAAGTALDIRVSANSAARAVRSALAILNDEHPGQGWIAQYVL